MGSPYSPSRSPAPSAALLLWSMLATLGFASSSRFVGSLSPGAALLDPAADPRAETAYQDCATAEPLATVPPAARPLRLVWVRVRYADTTPAPDLVAASRWIEARLPVSEVQSSVEDLTYGGHEGVNPFRWVLETLYQMQTQAHDWDSIWIGVLPSGIQSGWQGQAVPYGTAVVSDVPWIARVALHEISHVLGLGSHRPCDSTRCQPILSLCGVDVCAGSEDPDWMALWARLYQEPAP